MLRKEFLDRVAPQGHAQPIKNASKWMMAACSHRLQRQTT
jgi:hypothetical protein